MKAIVKINTDAGAYKVIDKPVPEPRWHEVLVQIKATGLCYTDISILNNKYKGRKPVPIPIIMGHEGAGIIAKTGEGVTAFKVGQRVGFEALSGCGKCINCRNGFKNMCSDWNHLGITYDGTFAEYITINDSLIHPIPDNVDFADAALLEPISLVVRSIEHVQPQIGDTAAIIGPGSVGLLHLQALISAGVSDIIVIGIDTDKTRFEIAEKLGASHIVNVSKEDPVDAVSKITNNLGVDIVIETANAPVVWKMIPDIVAAKGRISSFGLYPETKFSPLAFLRKGASIFGDVAFVQKHFLRAIKWLEYNKVSGQALITKRFTLDDAEHAFEAISKGETVKVLFEL